ncbi:RsmB/NOP family class I SAM-dependent RNA methyltransferase [Dinoroseobacter sp. S124A]|uniref:RsmB/NOP family class I SAM-dependent RNA methyltransferase n=1 Tax=Dinoroseobacter sp. S124A TaxID=3415128 RepID=UPI003C7D04C5
MTPAARVAAAIEVLDAVLEGQPAEQALSQWGRAHRFAGSKDRAALRDLVFAALRRRASYGARGGALTGRGLMIGHCVAGHASLDAVFSGEGYAPAPLSELERGRVRAEPDLSRSDLCDMPDWILSQLDAAYGAEADQICLALRDRAPLDLRVNGRKGDMADAQEQLAAEGITAEPVGGVPGALRVGDGARRVAQSAAYRDGLVEIQDAASQAAVLETPVPDAGRILDYCAGGGGKALALAACSDAEVQVHDIAPARMKDIPARAARAGVDLPVWQAGQGGFDLVFCDAPCSGSGTWRRAPEAKWGLTPERLAGYVAAQQDVLRTALPLLRPGGVLVYATCSILPVENADQVGWMAETCPAARLRRQAQLLPNAPGDGFFYAIFDV